MSLQFSFSPHEGSFRQIPRALIGHDARIAPSSTRKICSKNRRPCDHEILRNALLERVRQKNHKETEITAPHSQLSGKGGCYIIVSAP